MGCDIHATFEKYVDGNWIQFGDDSMYIGRNYLLFSILADVRNYFHDIMPISKPKGFPKDYNGDLLDVWKFDGHSRSWLTLQEILSYDWSKPFNFIEYTNDYRRLDWYFHDKLYNKYATFDGKLSTYVDSYVVSEEHYKIFKKDLDNQKHTENLDSCNFVIKFSNKSIYADQVGSFFTGVIPDMIKEANGDFNSVRMVFCFDN